MGMLECPSCGKPRLFGYAIKWENNGIIVSRYRAAYRLVLVESALLEDIYQRIEITLGMSIRDIVFEAERATIVAMIEGLMPEWLVKGLVRNRVLMHPTTRVMEALARVAGLGDVRRVFYHPFRGAISRARNVHNRELFAAMVVGTFERLEDVVYDLKWIEMGGELYFFINPAKGKAKVAAGMKPRIDVPLPGHRELELCPRCGFPRALAHLRWDLPNAVIMDERRGVRMSFIDAYAFSTVFRELIDELGEEIVPIIVEAATEYTLRRMEETGLLGGEREREDVYGDFFARLPLFGKGNPVRVDLPPGTLKATIENPYSSLLLSGELLAAYEAVEGRPGTTDIHDEGRKVTITITP